MQIFLSVHIQNYNSCELQKLKGNCIGLELLLGIKIELFQVSLRDLFLTEKNYKVFCKFSDSFFSKKNNINQFQFQFQFHKKVSTKN